MGGGGEGGEGGKRLPYKKRRGAHWKDPVCGRGLKVFLPKEVRILTYHIISCHKFLGLIP